MGTRGIVVYTSFEKKYCYVKTYPFDSYPTGLGLTVCAKIRGKTWEKKKNEYIMKEGYSLEEIISSFGGEELPEITFALNSLFCEWGYVVDLKNEVVEIYKGFNNTPLRETDRFFTKNQKESIYYPIKLCRTMTFNWIRNQTFEELQSDFKKFEESFEK